MNGYGLEKLAQGYGGYPVQQDRGLSIGNLLLGGLLAYGGIKGLPHLAKYLKAAPTAATKVSPEVAAIFATTKPLQKGYTAEALRTIGAPPAIRASARKFTKRQLRKVKKGIRPAGTRVIDVPTGVAGPRVAGSTQAMKDLGIGQRVRQFFGRFRPARKTTQAAKSPLSTPRAGARYKTRTGKYMSYKDIPAAAPVSYGRFI